MQYSNEEYVKFLGEGAYGYVNLVKYTKPDGSSFHAAVKHSYEEDYDNLRTEFQILTELKGYPRIVECLGDSLEQGLSYDGEKVHKLVLDYASEGSLSTFMDKHINRKLPEPMIKDFTRMILEGLVSIHVHGYVHCDLKSDNLLVFPLRDSYELKISDFGSSLEVGEVPNFWEKEFPFMGTPIYMPPESLIDGVAKKTLDLWSVGCLVLEMYTGVSPWGEIELNDLTTRLFDGEAPEIPESLPCDAREFIETCFARKSEERGSAYELLFHRFLHSFSEEEEEKIISVFLQQLEEEEEEEEEKIISVAEEKKKSFLSKLKLKLRITRRDSKKSMDVSEKKPLKLKMFLSKPLQFKKLLNEALRLKSISDYSLVFGH